MAWVRTMVTALWLIAANLAAGEAAAQSLVAEPGTSGDQLLFFYDATAGRVPFLVVANVSPAPLTLEIAWYAQDLGQRLVTQLQTLAIGANVVLDASQVEGLAVAPLYDEPFMVAVPRNHPLAKRASITAEALKEETMLLLGTGHCFRDHVLEACPEYARFASHAEGIRKSFEGSSLETIKHMVASGMGITVVPQLSVPHEKNPQVVYLPFDEPVPTRRVVLAWRRSFPRYEAIAALRNAVHACRLDRVEFVS